MTNYYNYIQLCNWIIKNNVIISKILEESNSQWASQKIFKDSFKENQENDYLKSYLNTKMLKLDFTSFYHNLYTHSIPWMFMGKSEAKKHRKKGIWNELDSLINSSQCGETQGIPVGHTTSALIAELFMIEFDKLVDENNEFQYSRYVDDVNFYYNFEQDKNKFLSKFNLIAREYKLALNESKIVEKQFPFSTLNSKSVINNFVDNVGMNTSRTLEIVDFLNI